MHVIPFYKEKTKISKKQEHKYETQSTLLSLSNPASCESFN